MKPTRVAVVGLGKIARDQHLPAIAQDTRFALAAGVSRNAALENVPCFARLDEALDRCDIDAVVLCTPPQAHFADALLALQRGKHVMLEKPPCPTVRQIDLLAAAATQARRTLFQSWHSRYAAGVDGARRLLERRRVLSARIVWRENVRVWHPGQEWLWAPGGFGVFDPGINALSILTHVMPDAVYVESAVLCTPSNRQAPIAAQLTLRSESGAPIAVDFDFRESARALWTIDIATDAGGVRLENGGADLFVDDAPRPTQDVQEYAGLYDRFAWLIDSGRCDVDASPLQLVADAFLIAERRTVEPFDT